VEASLRLDAVASAGFNFSRSKMAALIENGGVMVDWKPMTNPAYSLQVSEN
jgi:RNA-binding protein YlmH